MADSCLFSVNPSLQETGAHRVHVSIEELYRALSFNVFGNSSSIYIWDQASDSFVLRGCPRGYRELLTVESLDEIPVARWTLSSKSFASSY